MRIEIVTNERNLFSVWKMDIHQISTDVSKINTGRTYAALIFSIGDLSC